MSRLLPKRVFSFEMFCWCELQIFIHEVWSRLFVHEFSSMFKFMTAKPNQEFSINMGKVKGSPVKNAAKARPKAKITVKKVQPVENVSRMEIAFGRAGHLTTLQLEQLRLSWQHSQ